MAIIAKNPQNVISNNYFQKQTTIPFLYLMIFTGVKKWNRHGNDKAS
jgi:hypothetical protein